MRKMKAHNLSALFQMVFKPNPQTPTSVPIEIKKRFINCLTVWLTGQINQIKVENRILGTIYVSLFQIFGFRFHDFL